MSIAILHPDCNRRDPNVAASAETLFEKRYSELHLSVYFIPDGPEQGHDDVQGGQGAYGSAEDGQDQISDIHGMILLFTFPMPRTGEARRSASRRQTSQTGPCMAGSKIRFLVSNTGNWAEKYSEIESCFFSILSMDVAYDDSVAGDLMEPHRGIGPAGRCSTLGNGAFGQGREDKAAART